LLIVLLLVLAHPVMGAPACASNVRYPRQPPSLCAETIITYPLAQGISSITALAFGPDGALYYARPATSEIVRLVPDADGFIAAATPIEQAQVFASNLPEPPNGLTYYDGAWYVSGDTTITRLRDTDGNGKADEQQVIVRDLPGGVGGWLGNLHVGPDKRLYVAKASSCDACIESDPRRGALVSFALDGSDPQIVARGLRDSYDFNWLPDGTIVIIDNERDNLPAELNLLPHPDPAHVADFGWPRCDSKAQPVKDVEGATAQSCAGTLPPAVIFDPASHPTGVAFYRSDAFPTFKNGLLVELAGSWNQKITTGYALMLVPFDANGKPGQAIQVLPDPENSLDSLSDASLYRLSFYPDHLAGIAISSEGWIYLSVSEGRIYRYRPRP
jgi:glucose/arabinose dehydrogenase